MNDDATMLKRGSQPTQLCVSGLCYSVRSGRKTLAVLRDINLGVNAGEIVAILGPSGCGKSTLIHLTAGFLKADQGDIRLDGHPVLEPSTRLGVMFQDLGLLPWRTVRGNIQFAVEGGGGEKSNIEDRVTRLISAVGLTGFADFYPHALSGGMAQRVALARTLAPEPRVLLMDEPFRSLDAQTRLMMQEELLRLWEADRRTIVFVTHDVDEAVFLASRIVVLTARPATVRQVFDVPLPRPRTAATRYRSEYLTIRNHVLSAIMEEAEIATWVNEHAPERPPNECWIGYVDSLAEALPLHVAQQMGLFRDHHVDVKLWPFRNGLKIASLIADGHLQGGAFGPLALLSALDRNNAIGRLVTGSTLVATAKPYVAICVPKASRLRHVSDLKGHRVAVNGFQTMGYDLVRQAVNDVGIFGSLEIVPLSLTEMIPALEQREVDAALLFEPFLNTALAAGRLSVLQDAGKSLAGGTLSVVCFGRANTARAAALIAGAERAVTAAIRLMKQDRAAVMRVLSVVTGVPESSLRDVALPSWTERPSFSAIAALVKPLSERNVLSDPDAVMRRLTALEQECMIESDS